MKTLPTRPLTASEITNYCLRAFPVQYNADVWRNNNLAVKGRKFTGRRGVGDLTGYLFRPYNGYARGTRIEVEVKAIGDKLSDDQIEFLTSASECGCLCFVAHQEGADVAIALFTDYLKKFIVPALVKK